MVKVEKHRTDLWSFEEGFPSTSRIYYGSHCFFFWVASRWTKRPQKQQGTKGNRVMASSRFGVVKRPRWGWLTVAPIIFGSVKNGCILQISPHVPLNISKSMIKWEKRCLPSKIFSSSICFSAVWESCHFFWYSHARVRSEQALEKERTVAQRRQGVVVGIWGPYNRHVSQHRWVSAGET